MRYRKLDSNGDMQFGNGRMDFHTNTPEGVAQAVMTRLLLWAGEWFLNIEEGTPYQSGALGKGTMDKVDPMIRDRILDTDGVTDIETYTSRFDADARKFYVNATINTVYGVTTIQGVM